MKYWLKSCPRCSGALREEANGFGEYISCVQCGYVLTSSQEATLITTGVLEPHLREEEPQHPVMRPRRRTRV